MQTKKIGIVTWFKSENYGTNLQAYALYRFLCESGFDCTLISEFNYKRFGLKYRILHLFKIFGVHSVIKKCIAKINNRTRLSEAIEFFDKNVKIVYIYSKKQYKRLIDEYSAFVSGSDQIWNPNHFCPFYFLDFAGPIRRIAYSSSIGVKELTEKQKQSYRKLIAPFYAIGLREQTGADIINEVLGLNRAVQVVDPTLLLNPQCWKEISGLSKLNLNSTDYVFCYLIGNRLEYKEQVWDVIRKSGIKDVKIVRSIENPTFTITDSCFNTEYIKADNVVDFVSLIDKAALICTDSFHATTISIRLSKNFVELVRFADSDQLSQNSRIYDLLEKYGLSDRLYKCSANYEEIDYEKVNNILSGDISKSKQFLLKGLNS